MSELLVYRQGVHGPLAAEWRGTSRWASPLPWRTTTVPLRAERAVATAGAKSGAHPVLDTLRPQW